ncbi:penicillin-binding transpeptidase domain-containing protein [Vibrio metschnikovii]
MEKGLTLASLINDAPINQWDQSQGIAWRPKTRLDLRRPHSSADWSSAVEKRHGSPVLREVGLEETRHFLTRFGFELSQLPRSETIALGAGSLTPVKMAQGYSVFANGGYYVEPFYISKVEDSFSHVEFLANPKVVCHQDCQSSSDNPFNEQDATVNYAPQVISEQNAFLVREMMYSNIWGGGDWRAGTGWNGTGWRAQTLRRRDVGGKTGTTNDLERCLV